MLPNGSKNTFEVVLDHDRDSRLLYVWSSTVSSWIFHCRRYDVKSVQTQPSSIGVSWNVISFLFHLHTVKLKTTRI